MALSVHTIVGIVYQALSSAPTQLKNRAPIKELAEKVALLGQGLPIETLLGPNEIEPSPGLTFSL